MTLRAADIEKVAQPLIEDAHEPAPSRPPVNQAQPARSRHGALEVHPADDLMDTLPIVADWSGYGRHAAPVAVPLTPSMEPEGGHESSPGWGAVARTAVPGESISVRSEALAAGGVQAGERRGGWLERLRGARHGRRPNPGLPALRPVTAATATAHDVLGSVGAASTGRRRPPAAAPRACEEPMAGRPLPAASALTAMTVAATVAVPYPHLEPATARLQMRLREQLAGRGLTGPADWNGLVVTGPRESADSYGRPWFWYRRTLQLDPADLLNPAYSVDPARTGATTCPSTSPLPCAAGTDDLGDHGAGHGASGGSALMATGRSAVTQTQAQIWPVRPAPRAGRLQWGCRLLTAGEATRIRKDLHARLRHTSLSGDCTPGSGEDLLLAFEELTSNALRHGAGAVDVTIASTAAGWLLVVDDEAPDRPPVPAVDRDRALGGMGLAMVAGLSLQHGWHARSGRKSVWAELPSHR